VVAGRPPNGSENVSAQVDQGTSTSITKITDLVTALDRVTGPGVVRRATAVAAGERIVGGGALGARAVPTGIAVVDGMPTFGGAPRGRLSELIGGLSSGKTLLVQRLLAEATRDGTAVYLDPRRAFCPAAAAAAGVDLRHLLLLRPSTTAAATEAAATFLRSGGADLVVCDLAERDFPPRVVERLVAYAARSGAALVVVSTIEPGQRLVGGAPLDFALSLQLHVARTAWFYGEGDDAHSARTTLWGWELTVETLKAKATVNAPRVTVPVAVAPPGAVGTGAWAGSPRWTAPPSGRKARDAAERDGEAGHAAAGDRLRAPVAVGERPASRVRVVAPLSVAGGADATARVARVAGRDR
jgi:hypothetical protein